MHSDSRDGGFESWVSSLKMLRDTLTKDGCS